MRIGCLQFAPQVGDTDNNLNRADAVLSKANPKDLDLLVLPELAFSGYNFISLQHMGPCLEPTASGITSLWARTVALKYDCVVTVGYPEKAGNKSPLCASSEEYYNSAIAVDGNGETIANYRKSVLYYTEETWAVDGPDKFYDGEVAGLGNVAMGTFKWPTNTSERIDLHPYRFEAPWNVWDFAYHIIYREANLVVLSLAWLTLENAQLYSQSPSEPDMATLSYWLNRLEPVIRAERKGEIIVVIANRCGSEGDVTYAGTSAVLGLQSGEVKVYGVLGRGEKDLLVVDTALPPQAKLVLHPAKEIYNPFRDPSVVHSEESMSDPTPSIFSVRTRSSSASNVSIDLHEPKPRPLSTSVPSLDSIEFSIDDLISQESEISPADTIKSLGLFVSGGIAEMSEASPNTPSASLRLEIPQAATLRTQECYAPTPDSPTLPNLPALPILDRHLPSTKGVLEFKQLFSPPTPHGELHGAPICVEPPTPDKYLRPKLRLDTEHLLALPPLPTSKPSSASSSDLGAREAISPVMSPVPLRSPPSSTSGNFSDDGPRLERPCSPKIRNCSRERDSKDCNSDSLLETPTDEAIGKSVSTSAIPSHRCTSSTSTLPNALKPPDLGLAPRTKPMSLRRLRSTFW